MATTPVLMSLSALNTVSDRTQVVVTGTLTTVACRRTKAGKPWTTAHLADKAASVEVLLFPATYERVSGYVYDKAALLLTAYIDQRDDIPRLIITDLAPLTPSLIEAGLSAPPANAATRHAYSPAGTSPLTYSRTVG